MPPKDDPLSVAAAYAGVVLIWTTTPLAIQWSGDGPGFLFGVAARMVIGLAVLRLMLRMTGLRLSWNSHARRVYLVSGLSIFLAMTLVYWSAQHIPSGWIAVVFGLVPIITGLFTTLLLGEQAFGDLRWLGMLLGLAGLGLIFLEGLTLHDGAWLGVVGVTLAATVHSGGSVLLKRLRTDLPALSVTAGGLTLATPLFVGAMLLGPGWPQFLPERAIGSILYLGIVGSALGFPMYFHILKHLSAGRVALITLITPVTALLLGAMVNGETIQPQVWLGTALILGGLASYEYVTVLRALRRRRSSGN